MATHTDKTAIYVTSCPNPSVPSQLDIPLTITESNGITRIDTHMSTVLPDTTLAMFRRQLHLNKSEKVVFIFCWDSKWDRLASLKNGLFKETLDALKAIHST